MGDPLKPRSHGAARALKQPNGIEPRNTLTLATRVESQSLELGEQKGVGRAVSCCVRQAQPVHSVRGKEA